MPERFPNGLTAFVIIDEEVVDAYDFIIANEFFQIMSFIFCNDDDRKMVLGLVQCP
jgi:hypothetical protein